MDKIIKICDVCEKEIPYNTEPTIIGYTRYELCDECVEKSCVMKEKIEKVDKEYDAIFEKHGFKKLKRGRHGNHS